MEEKNQWQERRVETPSDASWRVGHNNATLAHVMHQHSLCHCQFQGG